MIRLRPEQACRKAAERAAGFGGAQRLAQAAALLLLVLAPACRTLSYPSDGPLYVGEPGFAEDADARLHIVSYNVAYARRVDLAIEALTQPPLAGADILALQEMDVPGVLAIARKLGYASVYFPVTVHPKTGRDFGNAILSPWPMRNVRKLMLPHKSLIMNQRRAATVADIDVAGQTIRVYSTHFGAPFGTSGRQRRDQADTILADARKTSLPVIILGDLNSRKVARHIATRGYTWVTERIPPTTQRFQFDHILVRGLPEAMAAESGTWSDGPRASDHHPVWAVLPPLTAPGTEE